MRRSMLLAPLIVLVAAGAAGQDVDLRARIGAAAEGYRAFGRVDDQLRWAPADCIQPDPSRARVSRAEGEHGRKVYFVYASDRDAYYRLTAEDRGRPRVGFTVVKESFAPRELAADPDELGGAVEGELPGHPQTPRSLALFRAEPGADGRVIGPGEPTGLFVMQYVGRRVRDSDEGWIYGTVRPGGEVTAAGRVASCMGCHRSAPHGRLFGLGG